MKKPMKKSSKQRQQRYPLRKPASLGEVVGPYNLDKALLLSDRIEDEEIDRKLQLRNQAA